MTRKRIQSVAESPPRHAGRAGPRISALAGLAVLAGLTVLALGGCTGPAPAPPAPRAAADPPAYAPAREVHVVSDALDRKLDRMLAAPGTPAGH